MADADLEILNLSDFPPVETAAWEAAIAHDLKGADYAKKLVWRTEEGLELRPYYRADALAGLEGQHEELRALAGGWEIAQEAKPGPKAIRADWLHEAGAHAVEELGYGMAAGIERLAELTAHLPVDTIASEVEFVFAVGPSYFVEIAKLRAARLMWAQVVEAFGGTEDEARRMRLNVRTPRRNKSGCDRYSNLLRSTTEAMAAVVGGCDALTVEPLGFDEHLARNVQRVIQEEAHLDAVGDPAGGSYYIEALTDLLARAGWKLMQQVEAEGGYAHALETGALERALAETRAARAKAYAARRRSLVGVNNYPNLAEKTPAADIPGEDRIAAPFERIRRRTAAHARARGRYAKVLLLTRGDVKMKGARANFSLNFFGCAGFDVVEAEGYEGTDADLIVLCSSDAEYPALAAEVCPRVKVPVVVAGNPKDAPALQAAGVAGFIHVASDMLATLGAWQDRLGMEQV